MRVAKLFSEGWTCRDTACKMSGVALACDEEHSPVVVPSVLVEWLDPSVPSLAVTGPNTRDVTVSLDVIAMCGDETEAWSIESVAAPAGQAVQIDIDGIDWLSSMTWAQWGVQLTVRAHL